MAAPLKLMCVLPHPDDESLGNGVTLARYADEGIETYLVCATRGEYGWPGEPEGNPGPSHLGRIREAELRAACLTLGVRELFFLDYIDGYLDQADPKEAIGRIIRCIRQVKPHVVITFGPEGAYGHPDHIAISQFTVAATVAAADPTFDMSQSQTMHAVSKLYYMAYDRDLMAIYQSVFGDLVMRVDGVDRRPVPWPEWEITTRIDAPQYWPTVWQAVSCHRSQLPAYAALDQLPEETKKKLWGSRPYYRVYSMVNGGRRPETDLFEGLR
jgi:LmbE family N-acetylglucosaminyl deacetylase